MIERRKHRRLSVNCWASMKHPLLGTITAEVEEISFSGLSVKLDEPLDLFVMMELDLRLHGDEWDEEMPDLPVQVVRIEQRQVALKFCQSFDRYWIPPIVNKGEDSIGAGIERASADKNKQSVTVRTDFTSDASTTEPGRKAPRKKEKTAGTNIIPRRLIPYSQ